MRRFIQNIGVLDAETLEMIILGVQIVVGWEQRKISW